MRRAYVLATLLTLLLMGSGLGLILLLQEIGPFYERKPEHWQIPALLILAAITTLLLFWALLVRGIDDWMNRRMISRLFWPMLLGNGTLAYVLGLQAIPSIDLLLHRKQTWNLLRDSDVLLVGVGIYILLVVAAVWQFYEITWGIRKRAP